MQPVHSTSERYHDTGGVKTRVDKGPGSYFKYIQETFIKPSIRAQQALDRVSITLPQVRLSTDRLYITLPQMSGIQLTPSPSHLKATPPLPPVKRGLDTFPNNVFSKHIAPYLATQDIAQFGRSGKRANVMAKRAFNKLHRAAGLTPEEFKARFVANKQKYLKQFKLLPETRKALFYQLFPEISAPSSSTPLSFHEEMAWFIQASNQHIIIKALLEQATQAEQEAARGIPTLQRAINGHATTIERHQKRIKTCQGYIESYQKSIKIYQNCIKSSQKSIKIYQKPIKSYQKSIESSQKAIGEFQQKVNNERGLIQEEQARIQELLDRIDGLNSTHTSDTLKRLLQGATDLEQISFLISNKGALKALAQEQAALRNPRAPKGASTPPPVNQQECLYEFLPARPITPIRTESSERKEPTAEEALPQVIELPTRLSLYRKVLTEIPEELLLLIPNLEMLNLSKTRVSEIPAHFNPPRLTQLNLSKTHVSEIPAHFNPPRLTQLDLSYSKLETLPDDLTSRVLRPINIIRTPVCQEMGKLALFATVTAGILALYFLQKWWTTWVVLLLKAGSMMKRYSNTWSKLPAGDLIKTLFISAPSAIAFMGLTYKLYQYKARFDYYTPPRNEA